LSIIIVLAIAGIALTVTGQATERIFCEKCEDEIVTSYFTTGGNYYHSDCFLCQHCEKPIKGEYTSYRDGNYHSKCFQRNVAKRCTLCDGVIQGEYLFDFWGNAYHLSHKQDTEACAYCGRFIAPHTSGGGVRYSDGRYICNICRESAVTNVNEASALMAEVARYLEQFGMEIELGEVDLHVIGLQTMQQKSGKGSYRLTGFTDFEETKTLFGISTDRRIDVYLLYGMPRIDVVSTVAHELAHVWQFRAGRLSNDRAFAEGSCNYAAYLVLENYRSREAEYVMANLVSDESDVYGEGFRRVKRFAEAEGIDVWLERLRKKDDLPKHY
jgi:hypothetical protein